VDWQGMPEKIHIGDEINRAIGVETQPITYPVERWHVQRFAEAIGDPNPLYRDEPTARKTGYGGVVVPPTFFRGFFPRDLPVDVQQALGLKHVLDGGSDWEWHEPVHPGDTLSVTARLASVTVKQGRLGQMVFVAVDNVYRNQFGVIVATQRQNPIFY
jgi:acyl dehydratase